MAEQEIQLLEHAILRALTGATVECEGSLGIATSFELTAKGAQDVIDKLRGRGFKIERA